MTETFDFLNVYFRNIFEFFGVKHPAVGVPVLAIMFGVILIKLTIMLFYYSFGFGSASTGKMTRSDNGKIYRKDVNNE